jgi:hypothetical protein
MRGDGKKHQKLCQYKVQLGSLAKLLAKCSPKQMDVIQNARILSKMQLIQRVWEVVNV